MSETLPLNEWPVNILLNIYNQCQIAIAHGDAKEVEFAKKFIDNCLNQAIKDAQQKLEQLPF